MNEVLQALRMEDIRAACGVETFRRGEKYFTGGRVQRCDLDDRGAIISTVRGSYSQRYSQAILVSFNRLGDIEIKGLKQFSCNLSKSVLISSK